MTALKAKQVQEDITQSRVERDELKDKIENAKAKLAKASENTEQADLHEEEAVVAKKENEEDLVKKKAEEELRKKLQADLDGFKEELEVKEQEYANATTQLEYMRRIKEREEEAKRVAQDANSDLLSDVSGQLGDDD